MTENKILAVLSGAQGLMSIEWLMSLGLTVADIDYANRKKILVYTYNGGYEIDTRVFHNRTMCASQNYVSKYY